MSDKKISIVYKSTDELIPYAKNPRKNDSSVQYVAESIKQFGFKVPIILDRDGVVVAGHTRLKAAQRLRIREVPCIYADDLTDEQIKAFRLADNKSAEFAEWDSALLADELGAITDLDMTLFGFDEDDSTVGDSVNKYKDAKAGSLASRFIVPPFSVLDSRMGYWKERKKEWEDILPKSTDGRRGNILGFSDNITGVSNHNGTSEFDPVLCEIIYQWFCPKDGIVIDPFAGGHTRGSVADFLGLHYTGIELRQEQVDANNIVKEHYGVKTAFWICDDSLNVDKYIEDDSADFIISCPPYADLEVYSDDPRDISTMDYEQFLSVYTDIIGKFVRKLKENRFAVFVVGDVRDKKGFYRNFISDTKSAFLQNGMHLYNELILVESNASAGLRAGTLFDGMRKVVKCHQNVLVFYKGDIIPQHSKVLVFYKGNPKEIKSLDLNSKEVFDAKRDKETSAIITDMLKAAEKDDGISIDVV